MIFCFVELQDLLDFEEETLEMRIQTQLAAEREEHQEIEREQQKWNELDNYEETDIDNVDDEMELRLAGQLVNKDSSTYSLDDAGDIEREFQRRLQQENQRHTRHRSPVGDQDEIGMEKMRVEREYRAEQERKIQLMIDDHDKRKANRAQQPGFENGLVAEQQKRMQQLRINPAQQPVSSQDDWGMLQRQKRLQQKQDQERARIEQRESDEQERQRKLKEVREQREQEQRMMQEYNRQKGLDEKRSIDNRQKEEERKQREDEMRSARINSNTGNIKPPADYKVIVKDEFKEKALADYERRRATLDKEVEKLEHEKRIRSLDFNAPPVAKKPPPSAGLQNNDDEPPPPRPPPPSSVPATAMKRATPSPSPSPYLPSSTRFSYSSKTVSSVNAGGTFPRSSSTTARSSPSSARPSSASPTGPANRAYSPSGQFQPKVTVTTRAPSRDDPSVLDFKQKMKMFGDPQKATTSSDIRSTFSRKQREYMD